MNNIKYALKLFLQISAFALVSGLAIYGVCAVNESAIMPGFSAEGSALLMAGSTFVALPIILAGICALDAVLNKWEARKSS